MPKLMSKVIKFTNDFWVIGGIQKNKEKGIIFIGAIIIDSKGTIYIRNLQCYSTLS